MKNSVNFLLILLSGIIFNMPLYAQEHAKKKVAVYMTGTTSDATYKKVIGAKLVNAITESGEYAAVERTADFLAALSAESDYQMSGEVRDSQIARLGQKFGVRYVVVADASELFDEYFIAARLINVETGLVERAFDINGPADSMAQLVSLSQKVAKGLLNVSGGAGYQSVGMSSEPSNMSLCVKKDGKLFFISPEQWYQMKETEKITYNKKGICFIDNGNAWIISMDESTCIIWNDAYYNKAAPFYVLNNVFENVNNVNKAMEIFGGIPLSIAPPSNDVDPDGFYWTKDEAGSNAIRINPYNRSRSEAPKIHGYRHRAIYALSELL